MLNRIRKVWQREPKERAGEPMSSLCSQGSVSGWAASRGLSFSMEPAGHTAAMHGKVGRHPWRMELGRSTRDYIAGEELRARAELGIFNDVAAMVINRPLKDALERRAYSQITDGLQTTAEPFLAPEMRWLAMYNETGWDGLPRPFWSSYAVLADEREHALAWLDDTLVELLLGWPAPAPGPQVPFMLVVQHGKCYLRMQYQPAATSTLDHAAAVFTAACESALGAFGTR